MLRAACCVCVLALSLQLVTANNETCKALAAPLGSSVVLPCLFTEPFENWTLWVQTPGPDLINLTQAGQILFLDPRSGRVKAFPMQSAQGNYSIRIDQLQESDLGLYHCQQDQRSLCVQLLLQTGSGGETMLLFLGLGLSALLLAAGCCCCCSWDSHRRSKDYVDMGPFVDACRAAEACPSPDQPFSETAGQQLQGRYNIIVYENDDQDPANNSNFRNTNSFELPDLNYLGGVQPAPDAGAPQPNLNQFQRTQSHRTKQKFHRELFNRLRQASLKRHYYVNQGELRDQQAASAQVVENGHRGQRKKNKQASCEYKNPIYNQSTDHLNRL